MKAPLFMIGARIRIRRGPVPIDPAMIGRTGFVVRTEPYEPDKIGVVLDGDEEEREFLASEVQALSKAEAAPSIRAQTNPTS